MTLEQCLALPERKPALEYDNGVMTRKVSPKGRQSRVQTWTAQAINRQIEPEA